LDVARGTGKHIAFLRRFYSVEGLDRELGLLAIARSRNPDVPLHLVNMETFNLRKEFDAVTCLFSAIGYAKSLGRLRRVVRTLARHLKVGGVLIVELWLSPERFKVESTSPTVFSRNSRLRG